MLLWGGRCWQGGREFLFAKKILTRKRGYHLILTEIRAPELQRIKLQGINSPKRIGAESLLSELSEARGCEPATLNYAFKG